MAMQFMTITGKIKTITGLHIGSGNDEIHIGGVDSSVIKDKDGNPYIPGSSLKGKMRSLLELSENHDKSGPMGHADNPDSLIPIVFGDMKANGTTRVLVRDCRLTEETKTKFQDAMMSYTEEKSENSIDRLNGVAQNPRVTERVVPDCEFDMEIVLRIFDRDDKDKFLALIKKGLNLVQKDALGGNGSRGYGKVEFIDLKVDGASVSLN